MSYLNAKHSDLRNILHKSTKKQVNEAEEEEDTFIDYYTDHFIWR